MAGIADVDEFADFVADRVGSPGERSWLGGASALVAAVALIALPSGRAAVAIVGALGLLAAWSLLAPPYAFALGHVALAAALPEGAFPRGELVWVVAVEVGLVGTLLASVTRRSPTIFGESGDAEEPAGSARRTIVGTGIVLGWVAVGVVLGWASIRSSLGLPTAGSLLVAAAGIAAYALHRYQLVSLGLVGDVDE